MADTYASSSDIGQASRPEILPISMVIVSDFEPGVKTWKDEKTAVAHYLSDPKSIPAEVIVMATEADVAQTPPPSFDDAPVPVRLETSKKSCSVDLVNAAPPHAKYDYVAVIEADSLSHPGWLSQVYHTLESDPAITVASGRTVYPDTGAFSRVMSLLDRGFMEAPDRAGNVSGHISGNAALYRREFLDRFPYPASANSFIANQVRQREAFEAGIEVSVVPEAIQYHAFGGWNFVRDLRWNKAIQYYNFLEEMQPANWTKASRWSRPLRVSLFSMREDFRAMRSVFPKYCRWRDLPLALYLLFAVRPSEWRGAREAMAGRSYPVGSAFR